jgi:DNA-binding transcriptional LysR family regulator
MDTDKNAMALYVKVVEHKSFSQAALRAGVPVSTVSRKISDLEKALGVRLLERSTRQMRMTEVGKAYFEHCRRGLEAFEAADALVSDQQIEISGTLKISVPSNLSELIVMPLVSAFQAQHPKVAVRCMVTDRHIDHIAEDVDLSIRVGNLSDSSLVAVRLPPHRSVLVASPQFLASIALPTHPHEVAQHVQVAFARWGAHVQWSLTRQGQGGGETLRIAPEPHTTINDYAGIQQTVVDGLGISEVPSIICNRALAQGKLVEVLPDWQFPATSVSVIYPSNKHLSLLVRTFRDFCVANFEPLMAPVQPKPPVQPFGANRSQVCR